MLQFFNFMETITVKNKSNSGFLVLILKCIAVFLAAGVIAGVVSVRMMDVAGVRYSKSMQDDLANKVSDMEQDMATKEEMEALSRHPLFEKKIVYDGDSIANSRSNNGGGYPELISKLSGCTYVNFAQGGARLCSTDTGHSVVDNLENLPSDGDLYCFEGGINDFWSNTPIGVCDPYNLDGPLDTSTICGAMETIFRYCLDHFPGKPVCFVIVHKVQKTAFFSNGNGDTFEDYRNAMVDVCQKYSIPYYDAFSESGLNGWNQTQSELYLTASETGEGDGIHPNEEGYKRYYVPQLLDLFEKILPVA